MLLKLLYSLKKVQTGSKLTFNCLFFTAGEELISKTIRVVNLLHWFLVCTCSCPIFIQ